MIRIVVSGSRGRMGKRILACAANDKRYEVSGAFDVGGDAQQEIAKGDVLIEFTTPDATRAHLALAARLKKAMVIGTTAVTDGDLEEMEAISAQIPIVYSPNMSVGVNVLFRLCEKVSAVLPQAYSVHLEEAHHVHKKDAPSGTAKRIAEIISRVRNIPYATIPIASKREGDVVGDHRVQFRSSTETLELFHRAHTRDTFAAGALAAAAFAAKKKKGFFTMTDVLNIS